MSINYWQRCINRNWLKRVRTVLNPDRYYIKLVKEIIKGQEKFGKVFGR